MKCKACGRNIKYERGNWHHFKKQHHWAIPDYTQHIKVIAFILLLLFMFTIISSEISYEDDYIDNGQNKNTPPPKTGRPIDETKVIKIIDSSYTHVT